MKPGRERILVCSRLGMVMLRPRGVWGMGEDTGHGRYGDVPAELFEPEDEEALTE